MFKRFEIKQTFVVAMALALAPGVAGAAFNSGSTGADGAFNPTATTELQLPPSGIFNFTSVNIPAGVTVTFGRNALNTPVIILASGDVVIAGTIDVSGSASLNVGFDSAIDYTVPGRGGPGGFDGGRGGKGQEQTRAGDGLGPGGGKGGNFAGPGNIATGGGGGGYRVVGDHNGRIRFSGIATSTGFGGPTYGSNLLVPLLGGSGAGGGSGGTVRAGAGGGGGGGAILIAASGAVNVTGPILANGGIGGSIISSVLNDTIGGCGGGGSGGAIRIVASAITGNGVVSAAGGTTCTNLDLRVQGGLGGAGRINSEVATVGALNLIGLPTLRIGSVAGIPAPAEPSGDGDITLPAAAPNPVTVVINTTGVPVTNIVKLTVTPLRGASVSVDSPPLIGTPASATTSVNVDLPLGISTLQASTTYTIVASLGDVLGHQYAQGERVEKIEVAAGMHGPSTVTLITVSGKRYPLRGSLPVIPALG